MPFTSIAEFRATESPTSAEEALIRACQAGTRCILGDGTLPPKANPNLERRIRADLIRLLILGGTENCGLHPTGVSLNGAYIVGVLDLRFTKAGRSCVLDTCRFDYPLCFEQAELAQLSLQGSHIPGLSAQLIKVEGSIGLNSLTSNDYVGLPGAKIGAGLICTNARFNCVGGFALHAAGAEIGSNVVLTGLHANGTVSFAGASIKGQLTCIDAKLNGCGHSALNAEGSAIGSSLILGLARTKGRVDLSGALISGSFDCVGANLDGAGTDCLVAERLEVVQEFFFRDLKGLKGRVHLNGAHVGVLIDDAKNSSNVDGNIFLEGFTYDGLSGHAPVSFAARKNWLLNGSRLYDRFHPQPYTQFAKVLREMGHASEARKVLMERDRLLFVESHKSNRAEVRAAMAKHWGHVFMALLRHCRLWLWDAFSRKGSGYGHAPQFALYWSILWVVIGWGAFLLAWQAGVMVPNSAIILTSPDWLCAMSINPNHPSAEWMNSAPGTHYETFYALPYALDIFVPFLSLGQESAWAATTVGTFDKMIRWFTFAYQIIGWAITALGIAAITGFVQKNQPD